MKRWFGFIALLAIAGMSVWLGLQAGDGQGHGWLLLALAAIFAASEASYWRSSRGNG